VHYSFAPYSSRCICTYTLLYSPDETSFPSITQRRHPFCSATIPEPHDLHILPCDLVATASYLTIPRTT
jgi:hypothetical protein